MIKASVVYSMVNEHATIMDYKSFTAEDLTNDAFFKEWVLNPTKANDQFWKDFLNSNPHQRAVVEEAKEFVLLLSSDVESVEDIHEIQKIKRNIDQAIFATDFTNSEVEPTHELSDLETTTSLYSIYYKITACLVLTILAGFSFYYLRIRTTKSKDQLSATKLEAPRGKRTFITLSDGTKIWLNADSHLEYKKTFKNLPTREVYLDGEAFFDVAEDKSKPFIVHTSDVSIKVLGTAFNVRSFAQDPIIETTLVRGRITINSKATPHDEIALLPLEQAVFKKESQELILHRHIEADNYTSWKHGELVFDEKPLADIIKDLERWYNVRIHMDNLNEQKCSFSGRFKNERLEEVLELFKSSDDVSFEIKNNDVFIIGNPCNN